MQKNPPYPPLLPTSSSQFSVICLQLIPPAFPWPSKLPHPCGFTDARQKVDLRALQFRNQKTYTDSNYKKGIIYSAEANFWRPQISSLRSCIPSLFIIYQELCNL